MDSQKKTAASTTKSGGSATSSRRATEKPSVTTSVARPIPQPTNLPTTITGQIPTTSNAATASPMILLTELELILKKLQPNVDLSQALASLTANLPSSNPTPITPSQPISQPLHTDIPIAEGEEGGDEWFDAVAGLETPMGEKGEEVVYSGVTIPLGDDNDEDVKDDAGSKPVEEEPETVEAQSIPREEQLLPAERREAEQVGEHQPMVEKGAKKGELNMEEEVEYPEVVVVTDGEDVAGNEPPS